MYLKSIELVGFKSFANRTELAFKPGLMAIVGPNGCGKSNICEAIRWVLGEKSAKALRGSKMEDCIFNGTDERKPLGMAEVSITFGECEHTLKSEFNEITVTRRVFRTGENRYFINKAPCRLKDIQRLFMDTGIGTVSYSLMEQGHIDRILSSRPEDRREIFEEASGINKYKTDKNEAIRKLEQTELNLVRLEDVIREVKRQIGSLQRQAGKARRYKTLREELQLFDVYLTQQTVRGMDREIADMDRRHAGMSEELQSKRQALTESETRGAELQQQVGNLEHKIAGAIEAGAEARNRLDRTQDQIRGNRQRIQEYRSYCERDSKDIDQARRMLVSHEQSAQALAEELAKVCADRDGAETELQTRAENLRAHEERMGQLRQERQALQARLVELESHASRLQNERVQIETQEGASVIRRERLSAEKLQLTRLAEDYRQREQDMQRALNEMKEEVGAARQEADEVEGRRKDLQQKIAAHRNELSQLRADMAGKRAQVDMLDDAEAATEDFPPGARLLLDAGNPLGMRGDRVLGALAELITIPPEFQKATEAVLRTWLDAVVVAGAEDALDALRRIVETKAGAVRLLAANAPAADAADAPAIGVALLDQVTCPEQARPLVSRLLAGVRVVDSLEQVPLPLAPGAVIVTRNGALLRGDGSAEYWATGAHHSNPLSRKHDMSNLQSSVAEIEARTRTIERDLATFIADDEAVEAALRASRHRLDAALRALAMKEGEQSLLLKEAAQARDRLETVTWEARESETAGQADLERKREITQQAQKLAEQTAETRREIEQRNEALHATDERRSALYSEVTEAKVLYSELRQRAEHIETQARSVTARIAELNAQIRGQSEGLANYETSIRDLTRATQEAEGRLAELEQSVADHAASMQALREKREGVAREAAGVEAELVRARTSIDELRDARSQVELKLTESRMRRQNLVERVTSEYNITAEALLKQGEPEWPEGRKPEREAMETQVAEIRTKLEAIGPVNLVAIEEYQELEERYEFLTKQQTDLVNAKQQLMDMIRKINVTSAELFASTFTKINENFQMIFSRFFDGGTAKLVLVNEDDVLESGIEIIARPPGKRLQNVSLLSGGERTLTAVALLFAIYMIKPSPFCVLDELDAALDASNIGRFVNILNTFLDMSQFLVVTHNHRTIAAADVLYGVSMVKNTGISKIVSIRFNDRPAPQPGEKPVQAQQEQIAVATEAPTAGEPEEQLEAAAPADSSASRDDVSTASTADGA